MWSKLLRLTRWSSLLRLFFLVLLLLTLATLLPRLTPRQMNAVWNGPSPEDVFLRPHHVTYLIKNPELCPQYESRQGANYVKREPFLFIFVESAPHNFERRTEWREKWGLKIKYRNRRIVIAFLLAKSENETVTAMINNEYSTHGDIIQLNYLDSYQNLTTKTIGGLHWTVTHCPNTRYVLKTDDDVIIFLPRLVRHLLALTTTEEKDLYTGYGSKYHEVQRSDGDRWQVSREEYPYRLYPPYILGMGILLSNNALHKIYRASLYIPRFKFEDIFVGMCARYAGVERTSNKGFVHLFGPELNDFLCEYDRLNQRVYLIHGLEGNRTVFYRAVLEGKVC